MKSIQIIIPIFNEEKNLPELWQRLSAACVPLNYSWRILFVNDGSQDASEVILAGLASGHAQVQVLQLSRNFGHQAALKAGLDHASADAVILMDGDLQDSPEAVPLFLAEWERGTDVVYAIRTKRKEGFLSRMAFKFFYRALGFFSGISQPADAGIFSLLDRRVLQVVNGMPEHNRYFPGLRAFAGFKQAGIVVEREARFADVPRVGFKGLLKLGFDAIFSFSYVPLRILTFLGVFVATSAFLYLFWVLLQKFLTHRAIFGWTSILGAILLLGGIQLIMLGIVGEYVARIYEETKARPAYVVAKMLNLKPE